MMRLTRKARTRLVIAVLAVSLVLAVVLAVALANAAAERRRLEEERQKNEGKQPVVTTPSGTPPSLLSGYRLLAEGVTDFSLLYFGDASIFGNGASDFLGNGNVTVSYPYRLQIREGLRERYRAPGGFRGRVYPHVSPSFEIGLADFIASPLNFRLAVLAPGSENLGTVAGATFGRGFGSDLESMIRGIRSSRPYCDVLLVVPHASSAEEAEAILSLAAHYGLVAVDTRAIFTADPTLLHAEGEHAGLPNDRGHAAYAAAILAAIDDAVTEGKVTPPLPTERLY